MNRNKYFSFSIIFMSILWNNIMVNGNEDGSKENQKNEDENDWYTVKGIKDKESNYTFRLWKATQIIASGENLPNNVQYEKRVKICTVCNLDLENLDQLCRIAIVTLKLGEKYDVSYADGVPVEQIRVYRLQRKRSKIHRERVVFARKCPTYPDLYLTSGRCPKLVTVIMKSPESRLRRFIQKHRRPENFGF